LSPIKQAVKQARFEILKEMGQATPPKSFSASPSKAAVPSGNLSKQALPKSIPLPSDDFTTYTQSAEVLYRLLAANGNYYRQGLSLCLARTIGKDYVLHQVEVDELRSLAEKLGARLVRMYRGQSGQPQEQATIMKNDEAKVLVKHTEVQ
jgi:hypothetical protein